VKSLVNFFDAHYDEIDLVTYNEVHDKDGVIKRNTHFRTRFINKTGVYDQEQKKSSIIDSLLLMKRYKILDYKATDITMDTQIRVFPTIIHVVNSDDIEALEKKICSYRKTEDIENEDF
jgi:hypothetical protein